MLARTPIAVAALLTAGACLAAEAEPPHGLSKDGATYALVANDDWDVSMNGSGFSPASQKVLIFAGSDTATSAFDRQDRAYIWARTCTAAPQTLIFRRDVFMPGPAKTFTAEFYDIANFAGPGDQAVTSIVVFINDKKAFAFPGANGNIPTTEVRIPKLFKYGMNTIEIRVVKRKKEGTIYGQCAYGNPKRPYGIYFSMSGEFAADLWLSDNGSSVTQEVATRRGPGFQGLNFDIPLKNFGASGVYSGILRVDVSGSGFAPSPQSFAVVPSTVKSTGNGLKDCRVTSSAPNMATVECNIFRLPPGTAVLHFKGGGTLPAGFDTAYVHAYWRVITPTRDPKLTNNDARKYRYFCSQTSTNPKCPPLSAPEEERLVFDP